MGPAPKRSLTVLTRPLLVCAAAAAVCACADLPKVVQGPPPVDPASPVAKDVLQAQRTGGAYPRFADIPMASTDVRPTRAWTRSIYDTLRLRRQMMVQTALAGPARTDTEAFAAQLRDSTRPPASPGASAPDGAQNAFVQGVRQRATPPSPAR